MRSGCSTEATGERDPLRERVEELVQHPRPERRVLAHPPMTAALQDHAARTRPSGAAPGHRLAARVLILGRDDHQPGPLRGGRQIASPFAIAGCAADRYSARMQRPMSASIAAATGSDAAPTPSERNRAARTATGAASVRSTA